MYIFAEGSLSGILFSRVIPTRPHLGLEKKETTIYMSSLCCTLEVGFMKHAHHTKVSGYLVDVNSAGEYVGKDGNQGAVF